MREEDKKLFPLTTVGSVVQLFRQQLTHGSSPDLVLLSVVVGHVENCMTNAKNVSNIPIEPVALTSKAGKGKGQKSKKETSDDEDRLQLKLEPPVELHIVEALCAKFTSIIKGYCDLSLFKDGNYATRSLVKRVSDIVWNTLSKSQYKDRAHLQSLYSYLTGNKLDCFGVAFAVVAGCQVLGFDDVHLALSEDHAWVVFGETLQTAEVTWHGKGNEDKRGQPVEKDKILDAWLYVGGKPLVCSRYEEVAALISSINFAISPSVDSLEVGSLQQELLWLSYDLGHLDKYPMALGNLADLEEIAPSKGRPNCAEIYAEAISVNQKMYEDHHVYPYTYNAGFRYRQGDYKEAIRSWAEAASVVKRYKYSKDDEEIYKEFMEINNELIPHIFKTNEELLHNPQCFFDLLQFYDGLCSWEEDSSTPVLHIGWVKPMVKSFMSFDFNIRSKIGISKASVLNKEVDEEGNKILSFGEHQNLQCVPDTVNNNYKKSVDDICDDINCDKNLFGHSIYELQKPVFEKETTFVNENFENMTVNKLLKCAKTFDQCEVFSIEKSQFINNLIQRSGEKIFNIKYLLGNSETEPFLDIESLCNLESFCSESDSSEIFNPAILEETKDDSQKVPEKLKLILHSVKMGALKDILVAEKMNASALHLQLTAQTQTETKKHRSSLEHDGRSKRQRRE